MMAVASGSTSTNDGAPIILDFNPEADGDPIPLNVNFLDQKSKLSVVECFVAIAAAS